MVALAAVVILALIVGGGLLARHQNDRGRLAVGASRSGDYSMSNDYFSGNFAVLVPGARINLDVEVGHAAWKSDDATGDSVTVKAPRGGQLVQLTWTATSTGGAETQYLGADKVSSAGPVAEYVGGHPTKLSIRGKGGPVVVGSSIVPEAQNSYDSDDEHGKLVAVSGKRSDLRLQVAYQGRSQTIALLSGRRTMGDFASLYAGPNPFPRSTSVDDDQRSDVRAPLRSYCDALTGTLYRTPYLDKLGWAPHGKQWLLVEGAGYRAGVAVAARWTDGRRSGYYLLTGTPTTSVTVNGRPPVKTLSGPRTQASGSIATTRDYVFSGAVGDTASVEVAAQLPLKRAADSDPEAPATETLHLRGASIYPAVIDPTPQERR